MIDFPSDVWSSGQMGSKLWLCKQVERLFAGVNYNVVILAGWCGLLGQLLLARERLGISRLRTLDVDPTTVELATAMLGLWVWQKKAIAAVVDINKSEFLTADEKMNSSTLMVVNTSLEHFESNTWWQQVPAGSTVILQGANMEHPEHVHLYQSEDQIESEFPMQKVLFRGRLDFDYASSRSFSRFMVIGIK